MSATTTTGRPVAIRKGDPLPYYAQLANILREAVTAGQWAPGDLLPSEAELCANYGLSRTAVRQALAHLAAEGLVRREKGRGTFVSRPAVAELVVQEVRGFHEEMTAHGHIVETEVLRQQLVVVPPDAAAELGVPTGSEVVNVTRLRLVDGQPLCYVETLLPHPRFAPLLSRDLRGASLYDVLFNEHEVQPRGGHRHVEAVAAGRVVASRLGVPGNSAVLRLTAVNLDSDGTPFERFVAWYRGDRTSFQITVGPRAGGPDATTDLLH